MTHGATGRLVLVATPIGNLQDLSPRAVEALRAADVIACEDTRHTQILLHAHQMRKPLISYHEHNERTRAVELAAQMQTGAIVALVSDAGTPAISDPGYRLIRAAIDAGVRVEWMPGPSAVLGALILSGLPLDQFTFVGFLPVKPGQRRNRLEQLRQERRTIVAFEAPQRLTKSLAAIREVYGDVMMAVCRELTKLHEDIRRGPVEELLAHYAAHPPRGEITLVFHPETATNTPTGRPQEDRRHVVHGN